MDTKTLEAEAITAGRAFWMRWRIPLLVAVICFLLGVGISHAAPPVQTFTRAAGPGAGQQTLTWDVTGAASCSASAAPSNAGWSGSKPVSGTAIVTAAASAQFTLACATAGDNGAVLLWTKPTQNTDGSALTDLAGFTVYSGQNAGALTQAATLGAAATTTTLTGLAPGVWFFALDAFNSTGDHSVKSGNASKTTTAVESASSTLKVTIPNPPQAPTVQ